MDWIDLHIIEKQREAFQIAKRAAMPRIEPLAEAGDDVDREYEAGVSVGALVSENQSNVPNEAALGAATGSKSVPRGVDGNPPHAAPSRLQRLSLPRLFL